MEYTTEFVIRVQVVHETNKMSYSRTVEFETYAELAEWAEAQTVEDE